VIASNTLPTNDIIKPASSNTLVIIASIKTSKQTNLNIFHIKVVSNEVRYSLEVYSRNDIKGLNYIIHY
jgi:hypothetical protein